LPPIRRKDLAKILHKSTCCGFTTSLCRCGIRFLVWFATECRSLMSGKIRCELKECCGIRVQPDHDVRLIAEQNQDENGWPGFRFSLNFRLIT
jgi:hypothetical protein